MSDWVRLIATGFIWLMLAIMVTLGPTDEIVPMTFILALAAAISTGVIWDSAKHKANAASEQVSKHKRDARLSRLVDKLDEDEVYQLEELLASRRDDQPLER
jgi:hypothetical protein